MSYPLIKLLIYNAGAVILFIIQWPIYWMGRLCIQLILWGRAECEPFQFAVDPTRRRRRAIESRRRGKRFVTNSVSMITGFVLWVVLLYAINRFMSDDARVFVDAFIRRWLYGMSD